MKLLKNILISMRPWQWTKNGVVFAAMVFALADKHQSITFLNALPLAIYATIIFCLVSSGVYILNDIADVESDASHPTKKERPIASGELDSLRAIVAALIIIVPSIVCAYSLNFVFFCVVTSYLILQLVYTMLGMKNIAILDIMIISFGFVLRAIAGATIINAKLSPWLLLCTFLLAMFLALCKRRAEKSELDTISLTTRASLQGYSIELLDQLVSIVSSATIICYAIYTLSEPTYQKFNTYALGFTIPFVMFGVFRYLDITYRKSEAQRPDKVLLTDIPIIVNILLYCLTVVVIFTLFVSD